MFIVYLYIIDAIRMRVKRVKRLESETKKNDQYE